MAFADPLGLAGQRLGPYVVREIATTGGVAIIYRGEHEALKSAVAVKVLRPELVEDSVRPTLEQMFLREAQILSQLRSDDILRALDHGRVKCPGDGEERPYIVVDWLEGEPLSDDLERRARAPRRPYTVLEALDLLEPIARALAVCHDSGIVHRDVNPRNVFLENVGPDRPPRAKLIDFGFAKEVARTEALRLQRVDGTLLARSPDYAAPEHYDRETYGELSENTDIYTFALMLVEMLTLEPPLRGATDEDLREATTNRADRPTPNNRGAKVSPEVEAVFAEALAIDQFERPGVLLEFYERLRAAATGPAVAPPATGSGDEAGAGHASDPGPGPADADGRRELPSRSGRPAVAWVVGALLLAAAGAGTFYWSTRPLDCPPGFSDCNGARSDGCEAEIARDPSNCGACGNSCSGEGPATCKEGRCGVSKCPEAHLADCNRDAADGCEADTRTDEKNCGECGKVCGTEGVKEALCLASKCQSACRGGFGDCDGNAANGCETAVTTDPRNCGRCGVDCGDAECKEALCAPRMLASAVAARAVAAGRQGIYFWNDKERRIERVSRDGQRSAVADAVSRLTALAVGAHRIVWAEGEPARIMGRRLDDGGATAEPLAPSLASETPLVVSANGYVSWANRAPRSDSDRARQKPARGPLPPAALRTVFSSPIDPPPDGGAPIAAECPEWPLTFAGDGGGTYCCDRGKPLTLVECPNGRCTSKSFDALCPEELGLDSESVYFSQDVRVLRLDRRTGTIKALAKRKKRPRAVTLASGFLYWLEGDRVAEVWRIATDTAGAPPELLARRQTGVAALTARDDAAYWIADSSEGAALYGLQLSRR